LREFYKVFSRSGSCNLISYLFQRIIAGEELSRNEKVINKAMRIVRRKCEVD